MSALAHRVLSSKHASLRQDPGMFGSVAITRGTTQHMCGSPADGSDRQGRVRDGYLAAGFTHAKAGTSRTASGAKRTSHRALARRTSHLARRTDQCVIEYSNVLTPTA